MGETGGSHRAPAAILRAWLADVLGICRDLGIGFALWDFLGNSKSGVLDTERSGEGLGLLVDRPGVWRSSQGGRWLAGSVPGWTPLEPNSAPYQSRYLSDSGRLFFNGAEMIFMPIWGGNETLCKARAIENQIPLVISSYDLRSAIYDQAGHVPR